jgi:glycine cleavage system H protein
VNPENLLYAKTHEWAAVEDAPGGGKLATVGISAYAVESLTDLVYIDLPQVGRKLRVGEAFGEIESVKAVSDLYSPVAGEIVEINAGLKDDLTALNQDCYGGGWMIRLKLAEGADLSGLLDYAAYSKQIAEEQH